MNGCFTRYLYTMCIPLFFLYAPLIITSHAGQQYHYDERISTWVPSNTDETVTPNSIHSFNFDYGHASKVRWENLPEKVKNLKMPFNSQVEHIPKTYDSRLTSFETEDKNSNNAKSDIGLKVGLGLGIGIPVAALILCCAGYLKLKWSKKIQSCPNYMVNNPVSMHKEKVLNTYSKHDSNSIKSCYDPWELERTNLIVDYGEKLGSGAFCNVFKGTLVGVAPVSRVYPGVRTTILRDCEVAVKMLPSFADDIARSDFMQEINFMKSLAYHPHLISMLGFVADMKSPLLLVEYCDKGDLLHFVREKKQEISEGPLYVDGIKIKDLLSFSWQISNGLEYLNSVGCIHRDIAARNVLIDKTNTCKIGDFGLCRLTDSLLYTARGGRLPLKWMAPESLSTYEYSFKSDVWSYGIVLWEVFSLGEVPFNGIETIDLLQYLEQGNRLVQPNICPDEIFAVISACWEFMPQNRPSFNSICLQFTKFLEMATESYGYLIPMNQENKIQTVNV